MFLFSGGCPSAYIKQSLFIHSTSGNGGKPVKKIPASATVLPTMKVEVQSPYNRISISHNRKIRRASPAEKETLREEKNGVTERITELRKRLKYADGIEKRSAHIDDCLNQIHDTVENQRSNQNGRTDRKREDALR